MQKSKNKYERLIGKTLTRRLFRVNTVVNTIEISEQSGVVVRIGTCSNANCKYCLTEYHAFEVTDEQGINHSWCYSVFSNGVTLTYCGKQ